MSKFKATPDQQLVIDTGNRPRQARDTGNILVSASAGSGKTRVLIERIIKKVLPKNTNDRVSLDHLVVVTFTEKAAKEMKERLEKALMNAITQTEDPEWQRYLQEQLALLPVVNIQTIDAFCRQIVNQFYYLIGLDPNYRLLNDQTELTLLKNDTWDKLVDEALSRKTGDLRDAYEQVAKNFSDGTQKTDTKMRDMIIELYDKARSHANPEQWLDALSSIYDQEDNFILSDDFRKYVMDPYIDDIHQIDEIYQSIELPTSVQLSATQRDNLGEYFEDVRKDWHVVHQKYKELQLSNNDRYKLIHDHPLTTINLNKIPRGKNNKEAFEPVKEKVSKGNALYKPKQIKETYDKFFGFSLEIQQEITEQLREIVNSIIVLAKAFLDRMNAKMADKKVLDFAGIELKALEILNAQNDDDQYEARDYYHEHIDEVLIDEYQDVNDLQEEILRLIGEDDDAKYRFMVGDVKQSIYRFRYSNPSLFSDKYEEYSAEDNNDCLIELKTNFRSEPEVINFVNTIFNRLMDSELGGFNYSLAQLETNKTADSLHNELLPEVHVVETDDSEQEQPLSKIESQAYIAAERIQQLIGKKLVGHDEAEEDGSPIQYSDIAILTNTRGSYSEIEKVFNDVGIPVHQDKREDYFKRTEIMTVVSLLQLIDNQRQDIPLVAALRSPIVGVTEPELAQIRIFSDNLPDKADNETGEPRRVNTKGQPFFRALYVFLKHEENKTDHSELYEKIEKLNNWLDKWQNYNRTANLSELLWRIYRDTNYLTLVSAQSHSEQRRSNLYGMIQLAIDFEKQGQRGLFQFIRYIEEIEAQNKDIETPQDLNPNSNAVELMTVHSSKGLEYPIVIYFDAAHEFNTNDFQQKPYVVSDKYGLGVRIFDRKNIRVIDSPIFGMTKKDEKQQSYSEEIRKLYVALTRAEKKLIVIACKKKGEKESEPRTEGILSLEERIKSKSNWQWVHDALYPYASKITEDEYALEKDGEVFGTYAIHHEMPALDKVSVVDQSHSEKGTYSQKLYQSPLDFNYAYSDAITMESNQSVSDLKRKQVHFDDEHMNEKDNPHIIPEDANDKKDTRSRALNWVKPNFIDKNNKDGGSGSNSSESVDVSSTEYGIAMHRLLEEMPFDYYPISTDFKIVADRLVATDEVHEGIYPKNIYDKLANFFFTNDIIGKKIIDNAQNLHRERPFALSISPEQYQAWLNLPSADFSSDDNMIIHGIIDGYFIDGSDEVWLFDYKTDKLGENGREELFKKYRLQLLIYNYALHSILKKKVTHNVLISLNNFEAYDFLTDDLRSNL